MLHETVISALLLRLQDGDNLMRYFAAPSLGYVGKCLQNPWAEFPCCYVSKMGITRCVAWAAQALGRSGEMLQNPGVSGGLAATSPKMGITDGACLGSVGLLGKSGKRFRIRAECLAVTSRRWR